MLLMPKAILQSISFIFTALALFFQSGCSDPEKALAKQIQKAADRHAANESEAALKMLEALARGNPDNARILSRIGSIYEDMGDHTVAAFFLEQASLKTPEDTDLLRRACIARIASGETAGKLLERLAKKAPEAMGTRLWNELGNYYIQAGQNESALDAYLKGARAGTELPDPATATTLGKLFLQSDNDAQAEYWFTIASESEDPNALIALFGLLEIKLNQEDWLAVDRAITQLDKQFPGAVDASEWTDARIKLQRWHETQEAIKKQAASEVASSKGQSIVSSDAVANPTHAFDIKNEDEKTKPSTVAFDPNIAIEPADPVIGIMENQKNNQATNGEASIAPPSLLDSERAMPSAPIRDLDAILNEAEQTMLQRDFETAIQFYWQALDQARDLANIWHKLSQAYFQAGQIQNAETTALEAIRLQPREVDYTLEYLRLTQHSKKSNQFLTELETAYDRFPRNPEIAISLARAYERIAGNRPAARALYQRFLEIAPKHPLRKEASDALARPY